MKVSPIPVTAKIRLGWDDSSRNYLEIARLLEDQGAALIAVHGRTGKQAYSGKSDWEAIAEIKKTVKIPVIANGDVRSAADIESIKSITGCDGVMIGRGSIGNPVDLFTFGSSIDTFEGNHISCVGSSIIDGGFLWRGMGAYPIS